MNVIIKKINALINYIKNIFIKFVKTIKKNEFKTFLIDGTSNSRYSPVEGEKCLQKILPTNGVKKKI